MKGMTLIETVVYTALFSVLLTGTIAISANLLAQSSHLSAGTAAQSEGTFVMAKLNWALYGADTMSAGGSACNQTLHITTSGYAVTFYRNGTTLYAQEPEASYPLTTENSAVTCFRVTADPALCGASGGAIATTTINGIEYVSTSCGH